MAQPQTPRKYVKNGPILPGMKAERTGPPVEKSTTTHRDWCAMGEIIFLDYIASMTGIREPRLSKAMRMDCAAELPGWRWKLEKCAKLKAMPQNSAFWSWKGFDIEAAIYALQNKHLYLVRTRKLQKKPYIDSIASDATEGSEQVSTFSGRAGKFELVRTESNGLLCGIFALCHSVKLQLPDMPTPETQEIRQIATSGVIAERLRAMQLSENFDCNFTVDQLAATLLQWGRLHGKKLQLGLCWTGRDPYIPMPVSNADSTVWIHSSNESQGYSHYSGMRPVTETVAMLSAKCSTEISDNEENSLKMKKRNLEVNIETTHKKQRRTAEPPADEHQSTLLTPFRSSPLERKNLKMSHISRLTKDRPPLVLPSIEGNRKLTCCLSYNDLLTQSRPIPSIESPSRLSSQFSSPSTSSVRNTPILPPKYNLNKDPDQSRARTTFSERSFIGTDTDIRPSPIKLRQYTKKNYREHTVASDEFNSITDDESLEDGKVYDVARVHGELHSASRPHQFYIEWVGYDKRTWVLAKHCCCPDLVSQYRKRRDSPMHHASKSPEPSEVIIVKQTATFSSRGSSQIDFAEKEDSIQETKSQNKVILKKQSSKLFPRRTARTRSPEPQKKCTVVIDLTGKPSPVKTLKTPAMNQQDLRAKVPCGPAISVASKEVSYVNVQQSPGAIVPASSTATYDATTFPTSDEIQTRQLFSSPSHTLPGVHIIARRDSLVQYPAVSTDKHEQQGICHSSRTWSEQNSIRNQGILHANHIQRNVPWNQRKRGGHGYYPRKPLWPRTSNNTSYGSNVHSNAPIPPWRERSGTPHFPQLGRPWDYPGRQVKSFLTAHQRRKHDDHRKKFDLQTIMPTPQQGANNHLPKYPAPEAPRRLDTPTNYPIPYPVRTAVSNTFDKSLGWNRRY